MLRQVEGSRLNEALDLLADDPVTGCLIASSITTGFLGRPRAQGLLGWYESGNLQSLLIDAGNLVPFHTDATNRGPIAAHLLSRYRRCSSIVGPRDEVVELWARLIDDWGPARSERLSQPLLVLDHDPLLAPDPRVRRSTYADLEVLYPACVAMFTEEVGVTPADIPYRQRVRNLVQLGHSWLIRDADRVLFKAEVGLVALGVAQIQGVWVAPDLRGQGIAAPALASVVRAIRAEVAPLVSLYVNDFNLPAMATYSRLGFARHGTLATILF